MTGKLSTYEIAAIDFYFSISEFGEIIEHSETEKADRFIYNFRLSEIIAESDFLNFTARYATVMSISCIDNFTNIELVVLK